MLSAAAASAVLSALQLGDLKTLERELQKGGGDLNAVDGRGFTPLMLATRYYSTREMKWLLDRGADPNVRSKEKFTAFNFAVTDPGKARLLMDRRHPCRRVE